MNTGLVHIYSGTGKGKTTAAIRLADYVSDINCIAHPYNKGVESRKGIEF